jgi:hypothetical protein
VVSGVGHEDRASGSESDTFGSAHLAGTSAPRAEGHELAALVVEDAHPGATALDHPQPTLGVQGHALWRVDVRDRLQPAAELGEGLLQRGGAGEQQQEGEK